MNRRIIITAIPIIGVNLTAIFAQFQFWHAHLPTWEIPGQLLFAVSLESVAVMLCYFAHLSMVSADSAFKLRLGAILFALAIATMNGSHYVTRAGAITAASIGVFACSAMSPILWGVYSRRQSRDTLISNGLIEGRSVRLGSARWLFHPRRSYQVFSLAVWQGETNPREAITLLESAHTSLVTALPDIADIETKADAVRLALRTQADSTGTAPSAADTVSWLREHGWSVAPGYVRDVQRRDADSAVKQRRSTVRAITGQDSRRASAGM